MPNDSPQSLNNTSLHTFQIPVLQVSIKNPLLVESNPPTTGFKLNIDGASRGNPGKVGAYGVLRDAISSIIFVFSAALGVGSNNLAEM